MYSLRTIHRNGFQQNICLGGYYEVIRYAETPDEDIAFSNSLAVRLNAKTDEHGRMSKQELEDYVSSTGIYAIINADGISIDLFKGTQYYIVMSNGDTYANLTKK